MAPLHTSVLPTMPVPSLNTLKVPRFHSFVHIFIVPATTPPPDAATAPRMMGVSGEVASGRCVFGRTLGVEVKWPSELAIEVDRRIASRGARNGSRVGRSRVWFCVGLVVGGERRRGGLTEGKKWKKSVKRT